MTNRKPSPLIPPRTDRRCPVCGENSYSPAGIHPQCAVRREDNIRMRQVKLDRAALEAAREQDPS